MCEEKQRLMEACRCAAEDVQTVDRQLTANIGFGSKEDCDRLEVSRERIRRTALIKAHTFRRHIENHGC